MSTIHVHTEKKEVKVKVTRPRIEVKTPWTQGPAGNPLGVYMGAYNPLSPYAPYAIVRYNGSSYVAKVATTGNLPTDTNYWELLAERGENALDILPIVQAFSSGAKSVEVNHPFTDRRPTVIVTDSAGREHEVGIDHDTAKVTITLVTEFSGQVTVKL